MEDPKKPPARSKHLGKPFAQMTPGQKLKFVAKLAVCILTLGMAFPNVMSE
jgi:hypothetical protein